MTRRRQPTRLTTKEARTVDQTERAARTPVKEGSMPGTMMPQSGDSRMDEVAEDAFLDWLLNRATRDECLDALDRLTAEEARGLLWRVCDEYVRRGLRTARAF